MGKTIRRTKTIRTPSKTVRRGSVTIRIPSKTIRVTRTIRVR